jgi:predicted AlkP superfamily pyrophosphatase or phosphodiesterase
MHATKLRSLVLALLLAAPVAAPAAPAAKPKLVVLLAVDQMRADYVDWYGGNWKGGLRRLFDKGAHFRNARYPYLTTITCPGHATIGTGAYPHLTGMILNTWYDRGRKKVIECTDDPASPLVPHGPAMLRAGIGDSSRNLMVPTLGDEMQAQLSPRTRIASFSMKARASLNMAGHKPDVALWFEGGAWVTSSAFTREPVPWVQKLIDANPVAATLQAPWTRLMPAAAYKYEDDSAAEKPPGGWGRTFPHELKGNGSGPGANGKFANSPVADEYLVRLARGALADMKLGQGPGTDLLALSFSMTDIVGHQFGPRSHEVQDVLARLDGDVAQLLQALDATVGADNYVLALSADHGVAVIPEQAKAEGKDAGRVITMDMRRRANDAIAAEIGPGTHVVELQGNDLYLAPGVHDALAAKPGAIKRVVAAVASAPGVSAAFDRDELKDPAAAKDPVQKAAALSYFDGRSGDIIFSPRKDWIVGSIGTNHGSINDYDQRVPVIFYGKGIKPGKYDEVVSPADITPTIAQLLGVKMSRAEGHAIAAVLK